MLKYIILFVYFFNQQLGGEGMRKKAFLALAALAVLCCSAPAYAAQAECQDWLGTWEFTYDNATTTGYLF